MNNICVKKFSQREPAGVCKWCQGQVPRSIWNLTHVSDGFLWCSFKDRSRVRSTISYCQHFRFAQIHKWFSLSACCLSLSIARYYSLVSLSTSFGHNFCGWKPEAGVQHSWVVEKCQLLTAFLHDGTGQNCLGPFVKTLTHGEGLPLWLISSQFFFFFCYLLFNMQIWRGSTNIQIITHPISNTLQPNL